MSSANHVRLGKTDIELSVVGLGCWQFSGGKGLAGGFWPGLADRDVEDIVAAALEGGVDWFDTAEVYGGGRSEAALAAGLSAAGKRPGQVRIATKWWPLFRTAGSITRTIDRRLAYLGGFGVDLLQVHWPRGAFARIESQMAALADLVHAKKIKAVGVSNFNRRQMERAHRALEKRGVVLASNQVRFSLLDRHIERDGTLDGARELGVSIIAYSPLAQGLLTGKFHDAPELIRSRPGPRRLLPDFRRHGLERSAPVIRELRRVAEAHQASASQVALRWLIDYAHPHALVIPGATRVEQARDNVGAMKFSLSRDEVDRLEKVSRPFRERGLL